MRTFFVLSAGFAIASAALASPAHAQAKTATLPTADDKIAATVATTGMVIAQEEPPEEVIITSRFREEDVQAVPVAVSVIGLQKLEDTGSYNVALLAQLTPAVQFFSSNPRNTTITIRGLGTSFGLTNDGLEAGVGVYIDQVYMSRPAAATFDFVDVERVEVLRGPQGTLFGKNTTAGAINIVIRQPTFERRIEAEISAGTYGFLHGRTSISGPISTVLAGRLSVSQTLRDGTLHNITSGRDVNNQNDFGARAQLLYRPGERLSLRLSADYSHQQSICCAQLFVRVGTTLKPVAEQFPALAAAAGWTPASLDPFDRVLDTNTPAKANQVIGGVSAIAQYDFGAMTLTSVSAWRTWNWDPSNDRDFTRLSIQTASVNPDNQNQYSQEFRLASNGQQAVDWLAGLYYFRQKIAATPLAEYGADATRWLLPQDLTLPPDLLDGYRVRGEAHSDTKSYAGFAQATWNVTDNLHVTSGLRYTYEDKTGRFDQFVSGGLPPANANELTRKNSIARPQTYDATFSDGSLAGTASLAYDVTDDIHAYVSYSRGHKSGGINLAGIPVDAAGNPILTTAVIKPEDVSSYEIGLKNQFFGGRLTVNLAAFDTRVRDYQVNVVDSGPGALRGYLSNIDKVASHGVELDAGFVTNENLSGYLSAAWTEGKYVSFVNGPCPLELTTGATLACDLSGRPLPGLPKWVISAGGEYRHSAFDGMAYFGIDASYRSSAYSDGSDSKYLLIGGYSLFNVRAGYISSGPWEASVWVKNLFDTDYFQYLSAQPGNSGAVFGLPGDPRTFGVTLRVRY